MLDMRLRRAYLALVEQEERSGTSAAHTWAGGVLIALIAGLVFGSARHGALLRWDDDINIVENPHIRGLSWAAVRWMFTDFEYMRRYTPLAWLNWSIDYELFGLTAQSCHVGNILLHAANAALVFVVVDRVLALWWRKVPVPNRTRLVAAASGALIWALHPLRVEIVAWASGRIYCQAAFFLLLATVCYLNAGQSAPRTRSRRVWLVATNAALAGSLLTYPLAVAYVGVLVVIDIYLLRRLQAGPGVSDEERIRTAWLEKIPFVIMTGAVVGVTLVARFHVKGLWEPPPTLEEFGVFERVMQAFYICAYYVWKPFVPVDLAPVYTTLVRFQPGDATFVLSAAAVVVATGVLFWKRREWPGVFVLWLTHLFLLTPVLGVTEHPYFPSDRYSYIEGLVWAVAAGGGMVWLGLRASRSMAPIIAGAVIVVCGMLSVAQIGIWRDSETLFRYLHAQLQGDRYRADISIRLGEILRTQSRFAEAAEFYREALRINPVGQHSDVAHVGLARIARAEGKWQEAVEHYRQAIRFNANHAEAREALVLLPAP